MKVVGVRVAAAGGGVNVSRVVAAGTALVGRQSLGGGSNGGRGSGRLRMTYAKVKSESTNE